MIIRTGTLADGSPIVTVMKRTSDLTPGLFLYGTGIDIETKILNILSATSITMTKNATADGANSLEITTANVGVYHERTCALQDVKDIAEERGEHVEVMIRDESGQTRDRYRSVAKRDQSSSMFLKAYPVDQTPAERSLEKAGLREEHNTVIWTPMQYWIDAGIDFEDIVAEKYTIKMQGATWEIKEKGLASQQNDTYLYLTFGIFKK